MKKNIGIIYDSEFDEPLINGACGGSETWAIQISKEFVKQGFNVYMFRPGGWILSDGGVEYVPSDMLEYKINSTKFEVIIFSRNIDKRRYDLIVNSGCTDKIYVQSHEIYIWKDGIYNERFDYHMYKSEFPKITKFIALSDFHKTALNYYCNIPLDEIEIIGNGCDTDVFRDIDSVRGDVNELRERPFILWTSCFGRGGDILIDDILPIVKRGIPNIKVKICGYVDTLPSQYRNRDDVEIVGFNLTKEQYYNELRKSLCWFYPCVTAETFNISVLDAVINNCEIVCPMLHGTEHTLRPFKPFGMKHVFGTGETLNKDYDWGGYRTDKSSKEYQEACVEAANMIFVAHEQYHTDVRKKIRKSMKNYVLQEHSWQNVVKKWRNLLEGGQN